MWQSLFVLGRQPALGLAELENLYGAARLQPAGDQLALLDINPTDIDFGRLGGSLKLASVLDIVPITDWPGLVAYLTTNLTKYIQGMPDGKIRLGINSYGLNVKPDQLNRTGLALKKVVKQAGRSVRVVPNTTTELNTAQTIHNQLTGPTGLELVLAKHGRQTVLAQVVAVQDIDAYAARDQKRPKRDPRVGMLPPKLAQIIVNLASGQLPQTRLDGVQGADEQRTEAYTQYDEGAAQPATQQSAKSTGGVSGSARKQSRAARLVVLDPFCGTGVILQESALMGYGIYGTDLDPRMIEYTNANLRWLEQQKNVHIQGATEVADATTHVWRELPFQFIATETYLGRPLNSLPDPATLQKIIQDVNTIHKKLLQNIARQTKPGSRMCLAVPAWNTPRGFKHLPTLDKLPELGYNRVSFVHVRNEELIYYRPGQAVARELVTLVRK